MAKPLFFFSFFFIFFQTTPRVFSLNLLQVLNVGFLNTSRATLTKKHKTNQKKFTMKCTKIKVKNRTERSYSIKHYNHLLGASEQLRVLGAQWQQSSTTAVCQAWLQVSPSVACTAKKFNLLLIRDLNGRHPLLSLLHGEVAANNIELVTPQGDPRRLEPNAQSSEVTGKHKLQKKKAHVGETDCQAVPSDIYLLETVFFFFL